MFNKVILITGAASGFGRYLAEKLILEYHTVYATDINEENLYYLEQMGANIYKMDVTNENDVNFVISEIIEKEGRIDVLVNNAGYGEIGYIEHISMDDHRYQFEVNYFAPLNLIQKVLPYMKFENRGQIINIASVVSNFSLKAFGAYSASKAALKSALIALHREVKDLNIKINIIEPDASATNFAFYAKDKYLDRMENISDLKTGGYDPTFLNEVIPKYLDNTFNVSHVKTVNLILKLIKNDSKKLVKQSNLRGLLLSVFSKSTTSNFIAKFLEGGMLKSANVKKTKTKKTKAKDNSYYDYTQNDYYDYENEDQLYDQNYYEDTLDLQVYGNDDFDNLENTDFYQNDNSLYNNQQDILNNDYQDQYDSNQNDQKEKRNFKIKETTVKHTNIKNTKKAEKKAEKAEKKANVNKNTDNVSKTNSNNNLDQNKVNQENFENQNSNQQNNYQNVDVNFTDSNNYENENNKSIPKNNDYSDSVDDYEKEWF